MADKFWKKIFPICIGDPRQFPSSAKHPLQNSVALIFYLKSYVIIFDMKYIPHLKFNSVGKGPTTASYHNFIIILTFDTS